MNPRNWTDQPEELEEAELVLSTSIEFPAVDSLEIRVRINTEKLGSTWYLTTGNLFSSQTVKCASAADLIFALAAALTAQKDEPVNIGRWGELMKPPERKP